MIFDRFKSTDRMRKRILSDRERKRHGYYTKQEIKIVKKGKRKVDSKPEIHPIKSSLKSSKKSPGNIDKKSKEEVKTPFKDTGIFIKNNLDNIVVTLPKNVINKAHSNFELAAYLRMVTSDFFVKQKPILVPEEIKKVKTKLPKIGIFMKNTPFYSGGRYYAVSMARMMARIGCDVTIVTDMRPRFWEDFNWVNKNNTDKNLRFELDIDVNMWCLKWEENYFDLIIGVPNFEGAKGFVYAKKWKIPCWLMIFETPNYVSEFKDGLDSGEGYWDEYKKCLAQADRILCLAEYPKKKAIEWLEKYKVDSKRFDVLMPYINIYNADKSKKRGEKEEHAICFVGRHVDFKFPQHLMECILKLQIKRLPKIYFIGSINEHKKFKMEMFARKNNLEIEFKIGINDQEKYDIICRCKTLVSPSIFEGFGITPAEAFYCEKPVVAYDIPIMREIYKDTIDYAPIKNVEKLAEKIEKLILDDNYRKQRGRSGYLHVLNVVYPDIAENKLKELFGIKNKKIDVVLHGKKNKKLSITVGIICLNSADTIKYCIGSVYDSVDEILIVEGAVEHYVENNPEMVNEKGGSVDDTVDIIKNFNDKSNKIKILSFDKIYSNKQEMQNIIAENCSGDIYLKVDSDEVYKKEDLERIRSEFENDDDLWIFRYKFNHFWHNLENIAVGGQWETRMPRCWRWRKDFRYGDVKNKVGFDYFVDKDGDTVEYPKYKTKEIDDKFVYHLSYAMQDKKKIQAKINYYKNRGIEKNVEDRWTNWKAGQESSCTHPRGTGVVKFRGELPEILKNIGIKNDKSVKKNKTEIDVYNLPEINKVEVSVGMIVVNEEEFLSECIENIMRWNIVKELIIVEGADKNYPAESLTLKGLSIDKTSEIINQKTVEYGDKIRYVAKGFVKDKMELRNEYMKRVTGTHLFVLDADEFYDLKDLIELGKIFEEDGKNLQFEFKRETRNSMTFGNIVHFWHGIKYRAVGGYFSIPHQRIYRFIDGMMYINNHNHPCLSDGTRIDQYRDLWRTVDTVCYHLGFCKSEKNMKDKIQYYKNRGEYKTHTAHLLQKLKWFDWEDGQEKDLDRGTKIIKYDGYVPNVIKNIFNK